MCLVLVVSVKSHPFLSSRKEIVSSVEHNDRYSSGFNLRPSLFLIYVNDLPNCLTNAECDMFADDSQIASASNNDKVLAETLKIL